MDRMGQDRAGQDRWLGKKEKKVFSSQCIWGADAYDRMCSPI